MTEIHEQARKLADESAALAKDLDRTKKVLEAVAGNDVVTDPALRKRCVKQLTELEGRSLPAFGEFKTSFEAWAKQSLLAFRQSFLDEFLARCQEEGIEARRIGDQPPVYDIGGLTLTIDFDKQQGTLSYAREVLAKPALVGEEILAERVRLIEELGNAWPGAEVFHAACLAAYRARSARKGVRLGERIDLVDLLTELGLEYVERGIWSQLRPLTRPELAFCLDQLARAGSLEVGGLRLELGSATGGTTKDKKRVLFLEAGMGGGQYYLSLRFVQMQAPSRGEGR